MPQTRGDGRHSADTAEERPQRRAGFHAEARGEGAEDEAHAELRLRALAEARPEVLSPLSSPVVPGSANWVALGPQAVYVGAFPDGSPFLASGRVTGIEIDPGNPSRIYLGTAGGGVWRSEDGGRTWAAKSDNEVSLAIGALAMAPSAPDVLYAGTGEGNLYLSRLESPYNSAPESYEGSGVLVSGDGGDSWSVRGQAEFSGACFYSLAVHPTDPQTVFAASNRGLHRSRDGGATWVRLSNGLPPISLSTPAVLSVVAATDVVVDPTSPETVYVSFWKEGVFRSTDAGAAAPSFSRVAGLPSFVTRISMTTSPAAPESVYALVSDGGSVGLYRTGGGATPSFASLPLDLQAVPGQAIRTMSAYTAAIAVDTANPDIVYFSGIAHYRATRDPAAGTWKVVEIGGQIHADGHALTPHPTDPQQIYAGTDGGIYRTADRGQTWDHSVNAGLSLLQFEAAAQHPSSDAIVFGGTQDNGTVQFRNDAVFRGVAGGDGGAVVIDEQDPRNVVRVYVEAQIDRSTEAGEADSFVRTPSGPMPPFSTLFYPPLVAQPGSPSNLVFGGDALYLDSQQGVGGWPAKAALPGLSGRVSAIVWAAADLIYAGTTSGQVYRAVRSGSAWTATQISAAPLPARWIWDIAVLPGTPETVVVVMSGFGTPHVHRGSVAAGGGSATWTDISGTAPNRLPDVPVNSLQVDPASASVIYVGTDIGVFRTADGGANWAAFNNGLPNTAVYDLRLHGPTRLLRAATHGRGLWEIPVDAAATPDVELFVRNHPMDTTRSVPPSPAVAAFADPLQGVPLGSYLDFWMCPDAKIDSSEGTPPGYQMPVAAVDYVAFESRLANRSVKRGRLNRVYVQIHNRGIAAAEDAIVKVLVANAVPGPPDLPADFWARFPQDSTDTSQWKAVGPAKAVPRISAAQPVVLEWNWNVPLSAAEHSCMLVIVDSPSDPIPAAHRVTAVSQLVRSDRRVGQRNLHVVDPPSGTAPALAEMLFRAVGFYDRVELLTHSPGWSLGLLLPRRALAKLQGTGLVRAEIDEELAAALRERREQWEEAHRGREEGVFEEPVFLRVAEPTASMWGLPQSERGFVAFLVASPRPGAEIDGDASVTLVQRNDKEVVGGNTYVLRPPADRRKG